jgi:hypothetical protein
VGVGAVEVQLAIGAERLDSGYHQHHPTTQEGTTSASMAE